jgi:hypothetical protein
VLVSEKLGNNDRPDPTGCASNEHALDGNLLEVVNSFVVRLGGGRRRGVACGDFMQVGRDDSAVDKAAPAGKPALGVRASLAADG